MKKSSENYGYESAFPKRFRLLMEANNVQQHTIANIIGVKRQSISQWINGDTRPDILSLGKIAEHFNVSTDYLLGLTDKGIVKTNRDKLNAMSNDEIKDFFCDALAQIHEDCRVEYDMCEPCPFRKYCRYKHNGFLHWLEMEAEDETR